MSHPTDPTPVRASFLRDDHAYMLPMLTFLALTAVGGKWPEWFVASYIAKTFVVGLMLWMLRGAFTRSH